MHTNKMVARTVGVLYIIGTVSGILSVGFSVSLLDASDYLAKIAENDTQMIIAALCVLAMGLSLALIPIIAFPVLRRHSETLALGYIVFRGALEMVGYLVTVLAMLLLVPISQEYVKASSADLSGYQSVGTLLEKAPDYIGSAATFVFLIGAAMFYTVLYQSKLVPRWLSGWGLMAIVPYLAAASSPYSASLTRFRPPTVCWMRRWVYRKWCWRYGLSSKVSIHLPSPPSPSKRKHTKLS
jgi:hypothetical protein